VLPAILWYGLLKQRNNLHKRRTQKYWGFLYVGFDLNSTRFTELNRSFNFKYLWEPFIMIRKMLFVLIGVYVYGLPLQLLYAVLLLSVFLYINLNVLPFNSPSLNSLENITIMGNLFAFIAASIVHLQNTGQVSIETSWNFQIIAFTIQIAILCRFAFFIGKTVFSGMLARSAAAKAERELDAKLRSGQMNTRQQGGGARFANLKEVREGLIPDLKKRGARVTLVIEDGGVQQFTRTRQATSLAKDLTHNKVDTLSQAERDRAHENAAALIGKKWEKSWKKSREEGENTESERGAVKQGNQGRDSNSFAPMPAHALMEPLTDSDVHSEWEENNGKPQLNRNGNRDLSRRTQERELAHTKGYEFPANDLFPRFSRRSASSGARNPQTPGAPKQEGGATVTETAEEEEDEEAEDIESKNLPSGRGPMHQEELFAPIGVQRAVASAIEGAYRRIFPVRDSGNPSEKMGQEEEGGDVAPKHTLNPLRTATTPPAIIFSQPGPLTAARLSQGGGAVAQLYRNPGLLGRLKMQPSHDKGGTPRPFVSASKGGSLEGK